MEIKAKKCKVCGNEFKPFSTMQNTCAVQCAVKLKKVREKSKKEAKNKNKEKSRTELLQLAQITFNSYIRERDKKMTCICCGEPLGKDFHAGHFFSVGGHSNVRFDEDNAHGQLAECNTGHRSEMLSDYALGLERRIGSRRLELLRSLAYEAKFWTKEELERIIRHYKRKMLLLNREV